MGLNKVALLPTNADCTLHLDYCVERCLAEILRLCIFAQLIALQGDIFGTGVHPDSVSHVRANAVVFLRDKDLAHSSRAPKSRLGSRYSGTHLSRRLRFS